MALGLNPLYTIAAVVCAAVPTAKTVYILAGEYKVEESLVAATVSITTLLSVVTLVCWLYVLSTLAAQQIRSDCTPLSLMVRPAWAGRASESSARINSPALPKA